MTRRLVPCPRKGSSERLAPASRQNLIRISGNSFGAHGSGFQSPDRPRLAPNGTPTVSNFRLENATAPELGPGQVLLRVIWLSLAPYMFWRMRDEKSYAPPVGLGEVMVGATVGEVVASRHEGFKPGDIALGGGGWQEFAVLDGRALRKIDPASGPTSLALGVLGSNGLTAYAGLFDIGRPQPGETVVVAAASGGVGSIVGQIARIKGARAVGIAGGAEKCRFVREELGFDECVDHREPGFAGQAGLRVLRRHRRLFRECRRGRVGRGVPVAQRFRPRAGLRPDLAVRQDRVSSGPQPGPD